MIGVGFLKKQLEQVSYYLYLPLNIPLHIQIIILNAEVSSPASAAKETNAHISTYASAYPEGQILY